MKNLAAIFADSTSFCMPARADRVSLTIADHHQNAQRRINEELPCRVLSHSFLCRGGTCVPPVAIHSFCIRPVIRLLFVATPNTAPVYQLLPNAHAGLGGQPSAEMYRMPGAIPYHCEPQTLHLRLSCVPACPPRRAPPDP
jgi:hypothetical protein